MAVCDSVGEPEIYATVRIYAETDSLKPACTGTTDYEGRFSGTVPSAGKYKLKLAATGKKPAETTFAIKSGTAGADLGTIVLSDKPEALNEVTVTALRPLVKREIDRISYDVGADTEASTSTLSETLSKVPLVTVDADGTIRIKGQTDFRIYKNNRPNSSYSNNAKELFKAIPAASIKRIEVITDPGSREDAEGGGLILNIVTDNKTSMVGVTGNINQSFEIPTYRESTMGYITTQIDKVTLSANGMFSYAPKSKHTRSESVSETSYEQSGVTSRTENESRSATKFGYWGLEGSWEPDTLNLITFEASQWLPGNLRPDMNSTTTLTDREGKVLQEYSTTYGDRYKMNMFYFDGAVNYQRLTRRKDEAVTLSYNLSLNNNKNKTDTRYENIAGTSLPYEEQRLNSRRNFAEHTVQLDWTRPYFGIGKLDVGGKFILRRNSSESSMFYDDTDATGMTDATGSKLKHRTTVGALYADWRMKIKKWNFRAGLRYEYTRISAHTTNTKVSINPPGSIVSADPEHITVQGSEFLTELNDFVPNFSVMYEFNDNNQLKATYQRNIRRPGINYLDPQVNEQPRRVSYGNPNLSSSNTDKIELSYEHMGGGLNYMTSVYARLSDDGFASVSWVGEDGLTIYNTYENVGKHSMAGMSHWLGWNGKKTRVYAGFDLNYDHFEQPTPDGSGHDINISRGGWSANPYIFASQKLPWELNLSVSASYWSGSVWSAYSWSKNNFWKSLYYSFSISRSFLKEQRLTVRLSATKPFGPAKSLYESYTSMPGSSTWQHSENYGRQSFAITIGYRFGSLRAVVKKTKASISNTDVSGGGSKGGSSGGN